MAAVLPDGGTRPGGILGQFAQRRPRIAAFIQDRPAALTQFGLGLLSGRNRSEAWGNAAQGLAYGQQTDQARRDRTQQEEEQARQEEARRNLFMTPEFQSLSNEDRAWLMANPGAADQFIASNIQNRMTPASPQPPIEVNGQLVDPVTFEVVGDYRNPADAGGADPFTLSPGQQRFDGNGNPIAAVPGAADTDAPDTQVLEGPDGRPHRYAWNPATRMFDIDMGVSAGAPNYFENTWDRLTAEQQVNISNDIVGAEQTALNQLQNFDAMQQLAADPNFYSGANANLVAGARRLGVMLGISVPDSVAAIEAFSGLAAQAALDAMGGSLGAGFSNADRDFIERTMPNLGFTPEGNQTLIAIHRAIATRNLEIAERLRAAGGRPTPEFMRELTQWAVANPLFAEPPATATPGATPPAAGAPTGVPLYDNGGIRIWGTP